MSNHHKHPPNDIARTTYDRARRAIRKKIQFDSNRSIYRATLEFTFPISAAIAKADFPVAQMTRTPNPEDFISNADGISR
jgi:hypothetical protein